MKRILLTVLLTALLCLCGCRVRVISEPMAADAVLQAPTEAPTEPPEETEPPTEPEETDPPTETPQTEPTEQTTEPTENPTEPTSVPTETATEPVQQAVQETAQPASETVGPALTQNGGTTQAAAGIGMVSPEPDEEKPQSTEPTEPPAPEPTKPAQRYTVTFDGNGGRVKSYDAARELQPGELYGTLPTPLWEGYDFLGWFTQPSGGELISASSVFSNGGNQTLYAQWYYDPVAYWTFTLQNRTQQVYLCQQTSIYFETQQDNMTQSYCGLISDTGSLNIAAYASDSYVDDDWISAKMPQVIIKCVDSASQFDAARSAIWARFPGTTVFVVTPEALGSGNYGLYARLALAKSLYGDWYYDVDLSQVASELGISYSPIG